MGRWEIDDAARSPDWTPTKAAERTDTTRHDHDLRISPLPDRVSPRSREALAEGRAHCLTLPAGQGRETVRDDGRAYHLRGSEVELLERAGQFRVTFTEDLKQAAADANRFRDDLRSLREQGLIAERTVTSLQDGTVESVVSVTSAGKSLLDQHRDPEHDALRALA
jgi:hypothetical protein